ncbi:cyclic GMP-AMP synthase-like receptor 3 [Liolophura sinensis]|uniref:cyclic GMP-AMP synthase-like receptor 3 n=1 Tax=Liolophura sinensis TaxID=3198878 RepID=UPI00315963A8
MVQTQLNKLNFPVPVKLLAHGPAVMLRIQDKHHIVEVDLVPTFVVDDQFYVAKPYKSYADNPERSIGGVSTSLFWRQSTSLDEKSMLSTIDRDQGCRRKCLKILKYMRTRDATLSCLTSFHFKNLVLHHAADGDWRDANMAERFLDLLQSLCTCLDGGNLKHYFIPPVNLLDGFGANVIANLKGRVRRLTSSDQAIRQLLQ